MYMLLLMKTAIIGLRLFTASLKILGPIQSNPVALSGSKAFKNTTQNKFCISHKLKTAK